MQYLTRVWEHVHSIRVKYNNVWDVCAVLSYNFGAVTICLATDKLLQTAQNLSSYLQTLSFMQVEIIISAENPFQLEQLLLKIYYE